MRKHFPKSDRLLEGKRIIETCCGITAFEFVKSAFPVLERLLSRIPLAQLAEYLRYDRSSGVIYIRCRRLPEVTRKPLFQELNAQCAQVSLHGSHDIACPADWLVGILSEYYGQTVPLPLEI